MRIKWLACCHAFFLADKECTYFHILVDLNFSNWILWILGDFHLSNWFLGEKNFPSYFSNIAPVQSHLLRQKFATAKWKYVRPGIGVKVTQSTYWKFSSLSHDMIEPRTSKLSRLSMPDRYKSWSLDQFLIYLLFSRTEFNFKSSATPIYIKNCTKQ